MPKRKPPKSPYRFHGMFGSKEKAIAKERLVSNAFIKEVKVRGKTRYAVIERV